MEIQFKRRSRICAKTQRELAPGEEYFSVLIDSGDEIERMEISASAWEGPPENCISWWKSKIPERDPNRFFWAPDNVIIDYFESFLEDPDRATERYVLALLLVQKRVFRLTDSETDDAGQETIFLACPRRNTNYEIQVVDPPADQIESIQNDLIELLFSDEPFEQDESESDSPISDSPEPDGSESEKQIESEKQASDNHSNETNATT